MISRRDVLLGTSCGIGYLAFADLASRAAGTLAAPVPHFPARAKRVIFLFMTGGPSQVDTFDHKPLLAKLDGQPAPASVGGVSRRFRPGDKLLASPWAFRRHGQSGLPFSSLFPHLARQADNLCMIHSLHCDSPSHFPACRQLHTGATTFIRPSVGAWVLYGLGTENQSLPGYVALGQLGRGGEPQNLGSAFLPAAFQATRIPDGAIAHLGNLQRSPQFQARQLEALQSLQDQLDRRSGPDPQLEGVLRSYEMAFRMQGVAPELLDLGRETPRTLSRYGIGQPATDAFGRNCLLARRLAEAGVRFIEVGGGGKWDQHARMKVEMEENALATDQPMAALLGDLEERGLLEETLVVWAGEFGRLPANGGRDGRDHNPHGYTVWLAGGGVKGGHAHGQTDELGLAAIHDRVHLHDLHATLLHLLGLDHTKLTYRYSGRDFRLTDVHGEVVTGILA